MSERTVSYGGFEIVVRTELNARGAWIAPVSLKNGTETAVDVRPMTVQPEWLTEDEAIRDAVEWGQRYIDRNLDATQPHSWVETRARAENWFRDEQEHAQKKSGNPDAVT
ncbi:hypothetical protein P3T18_004725 [Paraburkholderia sp. GAS199]|uniref:DUF6566 family protein n=1 Tax=Paraburkholderia sp. GAS199 TaxID=3035126 RepID=UPI003D220E8E